MSLSIQEKTGRILAYRTMIDDQLWGRLVGRIVKDEKLDTALAERIVDQALAYLKLVSTSEGKSYAPSSMVDIGWHTFILYTREYAGFCEKVAGRFIHHAPSDVEGVDYGSSTVSETVSAMKVRGITVDEELWTIPGTNYCSGDSCSGSCSGSGDACSDG